MSTLIVGANRGIGLEVTRQLHARGDEVIATYRGSPGGLEGLGVRAVGGVDLTRGEEVARLIEALEGETLECVHVVSGVLEESSLGHLDFEAVRRVFDTNAVGPLRVVEALHRAGLLSRGGRIGLVTSRMGSIADNTSGGSYAYRMSKAALNMAGKSLAEDLREEGIAVALLHPGYVRTDMTGGSGLIDADESAAGLIARMDALTLEASGSFWHMSGEPLPW
ncbi:MAG: SDR family oxidoreductase [Deltaproteobacteria bacterium]|nr:SDR family oxidoreductase [Deltaproteobacteria bacterium]